MAEVEVKAAKLIKTNSAVDGAATAFAASDTLKVDAKDKNLVLILTSTEAGNVTVLKGNGIAGVANLVIPLKAATPEVVQLDTSAFEQISGANKGKIIINADAAAAGTVTALNSL